MAYFTLCQYLGSPQRMDSPARKKNLERIAKDLGEERSRTRAGFSSREQMQEPNGEEGGSQNPKSKAQKKKGKENVDPMKTKGDVAKGKAMEKARIEAEKKKAEEKMAQDAREAAARKVIQDLELEAKKAKENLERVQRAAEAARRAAEKENSTHEQWRNPYRKTPQGAIAGSMPSPMTQDREREQWHTEPSPSILPMPEGMSKDDMRVSRIADNIRKLHPDMAEYSDEFLASQSIADLKRATRDSNNADLAKPTKRLEVRHQANYAKAKANPAWVPAGPDNRTTILHEARFLPGAAAKGSDLWLRARGVWGEHGVDPICNYDVTAMGMAGCITARGFEALHNPGSDEISIKLFTVSNVIHAKSGTRTIQAAGEDRFESVENCRKVNDLNELKTAFRNMKKAAFMIRPWDYSFEVLEAWITPTFWLNEELKGYKRASLTGEFIDHILLLNAANWIQEIPFLGINEIQAQWISWWGTRKSVAQKFSPNDGGESKQQDNRQQFKSGPRGGYSRGGRRGNPYIRGGKRPEGRNQPMPPFVNPPSETNTCTYYNKEQGCRNTAQACVQYVNGERTRMHHKCNRIIKGASGQNELCKQNHPQYEH